MKKIVCLAATMAVILCLTACRKYSTDKDKYLSFARENKVMPVEADLGDYTCFHTLCYPDMGLDNYTLIACYDNAQYQTEKGKVQERYIFETEALYDSVEQHQLESKFTLGEYEFFLLDAEEYGCHSPESYFIGFNDKKYQIAYVYYSDRSLDVVYSYEDILIDKCGWSIAVFRAEDLSKRMKT
ncbi:hypothetical protein [Ruminococcus difficilis]|uniref:Lipoprotein n=1 Tax=Ruminococcus difficilis TaxID=2763069 RepID=A0A935C750_9FIRM|nr:hypothetical protein [Ruminococcus difficilis]MBK6089928.1 hypothetical protein [Ruminococcus difficilis]